MTRGGREYIASAEAAEASVFDSRTPATGEVWDLLALPALYLTGGAHVLILGYGGGTVARLVKALVPDAYIVGVDADPAVWDVCRRWGTLPRERATVDALEFVAEDERTWDLIVEDVFVGYRKPPAFPEPGYATLVERLEPDGFLTVNHVYAGVAEAARVALGHLLPRVVEATQPRLSDNRVYLAGRVRLDARDLRWRAAATPLFDELRASGLRLRNIRRNTHAKMPSSPDSASERDADT